MCQHCQLWSEMSADAHVSVHAHSNACCITANVLIIGARYAGVTKPQIFSPVLCAPACDQLILQAVGQMGQSLLEGL